MNYNQKFADASGKALPSARSLLPFSWQLRLQPLEDLLLFAA